MLKSAPLVVLMFFFLPLNGQNISVTFTATGAAVSIDSISATNLATGKFVSLPGNETLILTPNTGIPAIAALVSMGTIYPNPFSGKATLSTIVQKPQSVYLKLQNLTGQIIAESKEVLQAGTQEFELAVPAAGIYLVTLTTDEGTACYKIICTAASESENRIHYLGPAANRTNNAAQPAIKSFQTTYTLEYTSGDVILYRCKNAGFTTILTDSPKSSKNYEVSFVACTDPDGQNYPVVKIGDQTWMAANLAYLPSVSSPSTGSATEPYLYVYGFDGREISEAKANPNYGIYGVLYNWSAANIVCPDGWHLPEDTEWTALTDYLGNPAGGKLKETGTAHWQIPNSYSINSSGFTALPGGSGYFAGLFYYLGSAAIFWTSTGDGPSGALIRGLLVNSDEVTRYSNDRSTGYSVRCLLGGAKPTARFAWNPTAGTSSTPFRFDASASSDVETLPDDLQVRWDWLSDGNWTTYSQNKIENHKFPTAGVYTVTLEVKDESGLTDVEIQTVVVAEGSITDSRDGHEYLYNVIGTQTWTVTNMAWLPAVTSSADGSETAALYYVNGFNGNSVTDAKATANYSKYGALYNWEAAKSACPSGWHLPGDGEWTILTDYLIYGGYGYSGSGSDIAKSLATSLGWESWSVPGAVGNDQPGNNRSGFSALPGGYCYPGAGVVGRNAYYWTSTASNGSNAWERRLDYSTAVVNRGFYTKSNGLSVHCIKGEQTSNTPPTASFTLNPPSGTTSTIFQFDASGSSDAETDVNDLQISWDWENNNTWTPFSINKTATHQFTNPGAHYVHLQVKDAGGLYDIETKSLTVADAGGVTGTFTDSRVNPGKVYKWVKIGNQTWMAENLAYLPAVSPPATGSETSPYYYVYNYSGTSLTAAKSSANYKTYGVLYNWEAAKAACPQGWHLPEEEEWAVLNDFLIPPSGSKMKETGTAHWLSPNANATNISGFTALAGGSRSTSEWSGSLLYEASFWSLTKSIWSRASSFRLIPIWDDLIQDASTLSLGLSVRCIKN